MKRTTAQRVIEAIERLAGIPGEPSVLRRIPGRRRAAAGRATGAESVKITGSVRGEAARKYPGFTYRLPIMRRIDIWSVDPNRLHPTQEYPRSVNKPDQPYTQTIDVADYEIIVGGAGGLWAVPGRAMDGSAQDLHRRENTATGVLLYGFTSWMVSENRNRPRS